MKVIVIEEEAFYQLIEDVIQRLKQPELPKWITEKEASQLLGGRSSSTLQRWRNEGRIRFSQPSKKVILYDRSSIMQLLEASSAHNTF